MRRILIVGGGYAGFYAAWNLEKKLKPEEGRVTIVDPHPYMTYAPFLPEVLAGSIEPRHALVSLRKHLRQTEIVAGSVISINHANKRVFIRPESGMDFGIVYDIILVTAGAVTRTFPIPGIAEHAVGLKHIEEAITIRDRLLTAFDRAANLKAGAERTRLLTATVVGGGFAGVEGFGELLSLATALLKFYPGIRFEELNFRLIESQGRILPEVSATTSVWVLRFLERRGGRVHLNSQVVSATDGHVVLSEGEPFDSNLIVWAAGSAANPVIAKNTDLPTDQRGFLIVRADLRVGTDSSLIPDAWGAGDNASIPDLGGDSPTGRTVPNAQNAVRQGKHLASNVIAALRGNSITEYRHKNLGVIATLGVGCGVFQSGRIVITGLPAWLMHRGYHVLAIPTWERKIRVLAVWLTAALFGRDIVSLETATLPRTTADLGDETCSCRHVRANKPLTVISTLSHLEVV
jgi:NADH dehydrogenase FAD-containing subunit